MPDFKIALSRRLLPRLRSCLETSTVHGVGHLVDGAGDQRGGRHLIVKVAWLLAILASLGYCFLRVSEAARRYSSADIATTVRANALNFEFPDVYICNENPISASYSTMELSQRDENLLARVKHLARRATENLTKASSESSITIHYAAFLVNSLPFQFLSDRLAHQIDQTVLQAALATYEAPLATFHHPRYINCVRFNLSESDRRMSDSRKSGIFAILFLDQLLPPADELKRLYEDKIGGVGESSSRLAPIDWDLDYGVDYWRPSGFRVFLTPPGEYPSELGSAHFQAGPGQQVRVYVTMQDTVYSQSDFPSGGGVCEENGDHNQEVYFVNPYTGARDSYRYGQSVCYYRELARLSAIRFNCSAWRNPLPWELRHLPHCLNVSATSPVMALNESFDVVRTELTLAALRLCETRQPCRSRVYSYRYSSSGLPLDHTIEQFLKPTIRQVWNSRANNVSGRGRLPGVERLLRENCTTDELKASLVQISVSAAASRSQEVQLSLAYGFNSLIADVGGLLGLFLGVSLLSVLEVLELLHDCVGAAVGCNSSEPPQLSVEAT